MTNPALLSPMKLGNLELQHRVVLAPLTRFRSTQDGIPTDLMKEYYGQRATPGGLLISEATFISDTAGSYPYGPGIYTKEQIEGWKKITDHVHEKGGIIYLQIWHVGRAAAAQHNNGQQCVSSSDIHVDGVSFLGLPLEKPRALSIPEIKDIIQDFRQAALNGIEAGFDGIEIHCANDYLPVHFINSALNNRIDMYGGSIENRCRFPLELIDAVAGAIGAERTAIRLSPWPGASEPEDATPLETYNHLISKLKDNHRHLSYIHMIEPRTNVFIDEYSHLKHSLEPFRKTWDGPFLSTGGYTYSIKTAIDIAEKTGSMIGFGRLFVSNPDLVDRIRNDLPLNKYDRATFFTNDKNGYVDYPFYKE
ncbi:FMN-linked oxidoreductase [Backusella circina FSU 941]|nr:FMN-linked oxidoreductase [Backusella circina FSU 941]